MQIFIELLKRAFARPRRVRIGATRHAVTISDSNGNLIAIGPAQADRLAEHLPALAKLSRRMAKKNQA